MAPFLEIITRTNRRPRMLELNKASLRAQTDPDWVQTFLHDEAGLGIGQSHLRLRSYAPRLVGEYVWLLDDDDLCIRPSLVAELKAIATKHDPDVIMLKMDHGPRGIQPDDGHWKRRPTIGHIGCSGYAVRRRVWRLHAAAWNERYQADGEFIQRIYDAGAAVYWHDVIASRVQRISLGRPE